MDKIMVKTASGFECELDANVVNNMELVDALAELDSKNEAFALSKVCTFLLGNEGKKALYSHLRAEDGRVPMEAVSKEVEEIFKAFGESGKK